MRGWGRGSRCGDMCALWHCRRAQSGRPRPGPLDTSPPQVKKQLPAYEERWARHNAEHGVPAGVDLDYVLWTDPDVLFRHDVNSCTLPAPKLLSIGPEVGAGGWVLAGGHMWGTSFACRATNPAPCLLPTPCLLPPMPLP